VGQKTHPRGFRLGIVAPGSRAGTPSATFPALLAEDEKIRKYLHQRLGHASLSQVEIERKPQKVIVTLHTARPGVVIGKGGSEVDKLRDELGRLTTHEVAINVEEVKRRRSTRSSSPTASRTSWCSASPSAVR
jgi:small subunit ribosomal protein S3